MTNLARYHAANLPELFERISRNSIGMDDYLDRFFNDARTEKRTTATPSLKRLSPAIFAFKGAGTFNVFKTPSTATGSVGETMTPSSKQTKNGKERPIAPEISQKPPPITTEERRTPMLANAKMVHLFLSN